MLSCVARVMLDLTDDAYEFTKVIEGKSLHCNSYEVVITSILHDVSALASLALLNGRNSV